MVTSNTNPTLAPKRQEWLFEHLQGCVHPDGQLEKYHFTTVDSCRRASPRRRRLGFLAVVDSLTGEFLFNKVLNPTNIVRK